MARIGKALLPGVVVVVAACGSPESDAYRAQARAYEAQEQIAEERLSLVEKYQDCVEDARGNATKATACESFLKAAEALK